MGVIVTLSEMSHLHINHFKDFIFSHFTLIDAHLERLKDGMEEALLTRAEPQRQNFLSRAAKVRLHSSLHALLLSDESCTPHIPHKSFTRLTLPITSPPSPLNPSPTQAYQSFLGDLLSLYRCRRIHSPVWLGLVSQQSRRREICLQFTEELGSIVAEIDTKDTKQSVVLHIMLMYVHFAV